MKFEEFDAQGNLLDIDHTHIEKIYGPQNSWIYRGWSKGGVWYKDQKVIDTLKAFNHLRREIREKTLKQYLEDNWPIAYNRFWLNTIEKGKSQCDLFFLIYELEKLGDDKLIRDILSIDFSDLLGNILSDHGFPTKQ